MASIMYIQLQMVAAIACMGGHDIRNDRVKTVCYACLCGNAATDVLKGAGITIGRKLTEQAIKHLSFDVIKRINHAVGFRLVTKFRQTGAINLGKAVPLIGGVVGGTFDGATTYAIGRVAKNLFVTGGEPPQDEQPHDSEEPNVIESLSEWFFPGDEQSERKPHDNSREQDRSF